MSHPDASSFWKDNCCCKPIGKYIGIDYLILPYLACKWRNRVTKGRLEGNPDLDELLSPMSLSGLCINPSGVAKHSSWSCLNGTLFTNHTVKIKKQTNRKKLMQEGWPNWSCKKIAKTLCSNTHSKLFWALRDLLSAATGECHKFLGKSVENLPALFSLNYISGKGGGGMGIIKGVMWKKRSWTIVVFSPFYITSVLQISTGTSD